MRLKMVKLLKITWFIACIAVLVWTFVTCGPEANATLHGECLLLAAITMALLTLPSGIVWWLLLSGAGYTLSLIGIETGGMSTFAGFAAWIGFVVVGYLQWFKLVPWLIARRHARHAAHLQR
jgi:hypothetical protein